MKGGQTVVQEGWVTTDEAQELSGYTARYLRQLAREGKVEAEKVGRDWLYKKTSLQAWCDKVAELGTKKHAPQGVKM